MITKAEALIARASDSYRPDARFLAALRIAYGLWIVFLPVDILWMGGVPDAFVAPRPGLFSFVDSVPSPAVLMAITVARFALAVLLVFGVLTLPVSLLLTATLITASGLAYSFSKVDHFILFELVPVFLAFSGWGHRWSVDALLRRRRGRSAPDSRGLPVLLFAMTIGWAMLTAAVPKILGGWLSPSRQATRGYIASDVVVGDKVGVLGPWLIHFDVDIFWKLLDYGTIAAEGLLFFLVLTPTLYRCWLLLLATFHIGVYLTLGISFADYLLVYAVFFAPVFMWISGRVSHARSRASVRASSG